MNPLDDHTIVTPLSDRTVITRHTDDDSTHMALTVGPTSQHLPDDADHLDDRTRITRSAELGNHTRATSTDAIGSRACLEELTDITSSSSSDSLLTTNEIKRHAEALIANIARVVLDKEPVIRLCVVTMLMCCWRISREPAKPSWPRLWLHRSTYPASAYSSLRI